MMEFLCKSCFVPALQVLKLTTVEPVIFLYMTASFIQFPSFQDLIYTRECLYVFQNVCDSFLDGNHSTQADLIQVQSETSRLLLYTNIAATLSATFTVSLIFGPVGDKYGRKLPIVMSIVGSLLGNIVNLLVSIFPSTHISYLLVGSVLDGSFGGYIAILMSVFGYIGHIASSNNKTTRIAVNVAMIYIAGTLGFLVHGYIIEKTNFVVVFSITIGLLFFALVYVLVFIENIKPVDTPSEQRQQRCCSPFSCLVDNALNTWQCVKRPRKDRAMLFLVLLTVTIGIVMLCTTGQNDVMLLYTKLPMFNWKQTTYGIFRAGENLFQGAAVLLLIPVLKIYFRVQDLSIILAGLISRIISVAIVAVANESWHLYMSAFIGILHAFPSSGIRSCLSSLVAQNEQGKMFGIVASIESLSALVATIIFNKVYPATLHIYNGMIFLIAALLQTIGFFIILWMKVKRGDYGKNYQYASFRSEGYQETMQNEEDIPPVEIDEDGQPTGECVSVQSSPSKTLLHEREEEMVDVSPA